MRMKTNYRHIFFRTRQMLAQPAEAWKEAWQEETTPGDMFRHYLLPIAAGLSVIVFLLRLIHYTPWQAFGLGVIHFIAVIGGAWCTYIVTREYLCNKLNYLPGEALRLSIYSFTVFILFHSIGGTLGNSFIGQLFTLCGFIFLRTLYTGTGQLQQLQSNHKTNILIITSLSIICFPVIITHILRIISGISTIHI